MSPMSNFSFRSIPGSLPRRNPVAPAGCTHDAEFWCFIAAVFLALWMMGINPAASQTLTNSDFDSDLSGWQVVPSPQHDWSVLDHEDDPTSGSLLAYKDSPGGGLLQATQCVEVEPGDGNSLTAKVFVPLTSNPADFYLGLSYFTDTTCQNYLDFDRVYWAPPQGEWIDFTFGPSIAPAGAFSAQVALSLFESFSASVPVTAHIDAVRLYVFADGFELGDTTRWSATVP